MLLTEHEHLFLVQVLGLDVVVRPLTAAEVRHLTKVGAFLPPTEVNEWICIQATLHIPGVEDKEEYLSSKCLAALPDLLAEAILGLSSFKSQDEFYDLLEEHRQNQALLENTIETLICTAFKSLSPLDVRKLNIHQQLDLLAKAEVILGTQIGKDKKRAAKDLLSPEAADKPDAF
ncbi:MAG: hypothetical protein D6698_06710 [Gammaproteobacteria bacterium]|nr:MAG: hypothetical protein D6698_06710 [Gammaproteobacteria bacterium]